MSSIIGSLPVNLSNGTLADATQVMSDFNFIVAQTNANAAQLAGGNAFSGAQTVGGDTVTTNNAAQTLLNKTLTSPTITGANLTGSVTIGSIAGDTLTLNGTNINAPNNLLITPPGNVTIGDGTNTKLLVLSGSASVGQGTSIIGRRGGSNIYFIGDAGAIFGATEGADTVIYNAAANNLRFYTNANERMRITAAGVIQNAAGIELGYKDIPQRIVSGADAPSAADRGKHVLQNAVAAFTINSGIFLAGNSFILYNNTASNISIIQGAGTTLRLDGTATTGTRTLAPFGKAVILALGGEVFSVSGAGVT